MTTVAEWAGRQLARRGVRHFFGLVGSGNFTLTNALVAGGATFVPSRHEGGAVAMADAYARVTGGLGVCSVHQGPGLTNTVTGLTEAVKSRTPLLVLAADTAGAAVNSNFRLDQARLVESVGAVAERIHGPASAAADLGRALRRVLLESRPVVLMLPLDVQAAAAEPRDLPEVFPVPPARPPEAAVAEVAHLFAAAQRPLLLAGRGAALAGAGALLERLGDLTGSLLATSALGKDLFAASPWNLGISGGFATPLAAELIGTADLVVAFGASLNMWTTKHGHLPAPGARVVQVDRDAAALGRQRPVDLGLAADAAETAAALIAELERKGRAPAGWRSPELAGRIAAGTWQRQPFTAADGPEHVDPRALSLALDEMLPAERTVAVDSGHFMGFPARYLRVPEPSAFVFAQAFMSVGLGLAGAIGAAVARPDRLTVAALGDGGLLMALPELETAARLGLHLLVLVYNDAAYGAEVHHFAPDGQPLDTVRFPETDFAALGRALGLEGLTVRSVGDLEAVRHWLAAQGRPALVVDAKVTPSLAAEWLEEAFRGH